VPKKRKDEDPGLHFLKAEDDIKNSRLRNREVLTWIAPPNGRKEGRKECRTPSRTLHIFISLTFVSAQKARTNNHVEVLDGIPTTKATSGGTYAVFWLLAILWIGMFAGLIAQWSSHYSTPAKKVEDEGFDPGPTDGIPNGAQNGPVVGCLTMDLIVG